jgi:hypothetical protein
MRGQTMQASDATAYWYRWTTEKPQKDGQPVLKRTLEETYNKIVLDIYDTPPQDVLARKKDGFDPKTHEWFARKPFLTSGYGAYDGRCGWCGSLETSCISFGIGGIALGVDEGSADIICNDPKCGRYTKMEYYKDSS